MCGRYTLSQTSLGLFAERFQAASPPASAASYNIAPGRPVAAIIEAADGSRSSELMHWGLIPSWAKQSGSSYKMINARSETVAEKPAYRGLIDQHRCLIPADGFFEWQPQDEAPKQPWWFHLPAQQLFAFAGLWTSWQPGPEVEAVQSCTILTTAANTIVAPVHHRMPLILSADGEQHWLDRSVDGAAALKALAASDNAALVAQAVGRVVNSTANQGPECIAPIAADEPPSTSLF